MDFRRRCVSFAARKGWRMTQQSKDSEGPDFEFYARGMWKSEDLKESIRKVPHSHLTSLVCGGVAIFALSKWSLLAGEPVTAASVAVGLMILAVIHSLLVRKGHGKTSNKARDGPVESGSLTPSEGSA